jgi:hypothetical protein
LAVSFFFSKFVLICQYPISIFTLKTVSELSDKWFGMFIPDPDPGSRGQKSTGSRIPNLYPPHCQYHKALVKCTVVRNFWFFSLYLFPFWVLKKYKAN